MRVDAGTGPMADDTPRDGRVDISRFEDIPGQEELWIDTRLPGHARTLFNVIGTNVAEHPDAHEAIPAVDFNLAIVEAPPGNGAALHDHETVEVFMPLTGEWEVYYGDRSHELDGEERVILEQWDAIQIPPGVFRGFRNAGDEEAYLMALTGGEDPGRVTWPTKIVDEAERLGLARNDDGDLVELTDRGGR